MVEKIRIGNNILVKWSILDESGVAYELESRSGYSVELRCGSTPVSASVQSVRGNTITLLYAGRNQRLLGKYHLKYTESAGDLMITFDQRDIFELVEHSWQAGAGVDSGNVTVDVTAHLPVVQGPKGEKGDKGDKGDPGETTITSQGIQGALGYIPYGKPSAGIPSTDLSSSVQISLGKADTALQEHQDISGKVDKIPGKGLSTNDYTNEDKAKLESTIPEAPMTGLMYGRQGGQWQPIALISGLVVTINHPEGVYDSDYTVVVRAAGTEERYTYTGPGMAISVPAGTNVRVSVIAPNGYTSPMSYNYNSILGVTQQYVGESIYLIDGIYIFTIDGSYVPSASWNPLDNANAVGVGYKSSDLSFVVAKNMASLDSDTGVFVQSIVNAPRIMWGSYNFDCGSIVPLPMLQAESTSDALVLICGERNSEIMVQSHIALQPNWRNESIISSSEQGYFPSAMACHKFKTPTDADYGNWRLPDVREGNAIYSCANALLLLDTDVSASATMYHSCVPKTNNTQFFTPYTYGLREHTRNAKSEGGDKLVVRPVRNF